MKKKLLRPLLTACFLTLLVPVAARWPCVCLPHCYYRRLLKAIVDDTPDDSAASCALLREFADTQWEEGC